MKHTFVLIIGTLAAGLIASAAATQHPAPSDWDRAGAARYLDARMDLWFAGAKQLQSARGASACVSCHTGVPYALARPALRNAMHASTPTPQETRLTEIVTGRVDTYGSHELFYDFNEAKQRESRGTEAVLNALVLATVDADRDRREIAEPTRKAFKRLWDLQRADGAWDWLDFGLEPFESTEAAYYGASLAALAIGIAPGLTTTHDPDSRAAIDRLGDYLGSTYPSQSLFNQVWALLASTRLTGWLTDAQRDALIAEIRGRQRDDGGWSLQTLGPWRWSRPAAPFTAPGPVDQALLAQSDAYATGLTVYTLRRAGVRTDDSSVARGVSWLTAHQQEVQVGEQKHRAWRAYSLNFDREHGGPKGEPFRRMFMSDVATAFAVLALAPSD